MKVDHPKMLSRLPGLTLKQFLGGKSFGLFKLTQVKKTFLSKYMLILLKMLIFYFEYRFHHTLKFCFFLRRLLYVDVIFPQFAQVSNKITLEAI